MVAKGKRREIPTASDRDVAEATRRGLVVLVGGPWNENWYFADDYREESAASSRKVGYTETPERRTNPGEWGTGTVYRFDPALVPAAPVAESVHRESSLCSKCGEKEPGPGGVLCPECRVAIESWRWGESDAAA